MPNISILKPAKAKWRYLDFILSFDLDLEQQINQIENESSICTRMILSKQKLCLTNSEFEYLKTRYFVLYLTGNGVKMDLLVWFLIKCGAHVKETSNSLPLRHFFTPGSVI